MFFREWQIWFHSHHKCLFPNLSVFSFVPVNLLSWYFLFCIVPEMSYLCTFLTDCYLPNVAKCKWITTFNFWPSAAFIFPHLPLDYAKITETDSWFPVWVFSYIMPSSLSSRNSTHITSVVCVYWRVKSSGTLCCVDW
jgi:hypothetical protein